MKRLILLSSLLTSTLGFSQVSNTIEFNSDSFISSVKNFTKDFNFTYYAKYLGPSLGSGHKGGETFDRFNSGQNYTGGEIEANGAYEVYQAFRLGYRFKNNGVLSYGVTFQEDLNDAQAKTYDENGKRMLNNQYRKGYSENNHRVAYWTPIYSNSTFFISGSLYYEMPTTKSSQENDMNYGVGFQPTLGFFTSNPYIMTGINFSFERDVYKTSEFYQNEGDMYPTRYQVARVSLNPYFNYAVTEKTTLKSALLFDWDQKGNQAGTTNFNANMVDIMSLGASYRFTNNISGEFFVEAALKEMSLNRTATGLALTLSL